MAIHRFPIGPLESNAYLVENGTDAIIFDAPKSTGPLMEIIRAKELKIHALLCTHLHFDHISGIAQFHQLTQAPIYAGQGDIEMKQVFFSRAMTFGMGTVDDFDANPLSEGKTMYGSLECIQYSTPGHSQGGFCFYFPEEKAAITGDTLFRRSIGRTDLPGGDFEALIKSIQEKIYSLPDDTILYAGHDLPSSIGEEKRLNPHCQAL